MSRGRQVSNAISARSAKARDAELRLFPGRLLFEPDAIKPYRVFTPFWKACLAAPAPRAPLPQPKIARFAAAAGETLASFKLLPTTPDWAGGLRATWTPGEHAARARLHRFIDDGLAGYADDRGALDGDTTSRLSPHLHFGELSPNQVWHAVNHAATGARGKLDRGAEAFCASSAGANSRIICCTASRPSRTRRSGRNSRVSPGVTTRARSTPGGAARRATPSSMRRCASFGGPASCRTARA